MAMFDLGLYDIQSRSSNYSFTLWAVAVGSRQSQLILSVVVVDNMLPFHYYYVDPAPRFARHIIKLIAFTDSPMT